MRPGRLELPRALRPTRPSTLRAGCSWCPLCPDRLFCRGFAGRGWTTWTICNGMDVAIPLPRNRLPAEAPPSTFGATSCDLVRPLASQRRAGRTRTVSAPLRKPCLVARARMSPTRRTRTRMRALPVSPVTAALPAKRIRTPFSARRRPSAEKNARNRSVLLVPACIRRGETPNLIRGPLRHAV